MNDQRFNPYAAPRSVETRVNNARSSAIAGLGMPSVALLVLATLWVIAWLHAIFVLVVYGSPTQPSLRIGDPALANLVLLSISAAASAFIAFGALIMRRGKCYRVSVAVAIIACIPVLSPVICIGIPFGIWALIVLGRTEVRAAFAAHEI